MKKCNWCGKEIIEKKENLFNWCCRKCWRKDYYYRNREENIKKTRQWVLDNYEKVKEYKREYFKKNHVPKRERLLTEEEKKQRKREYGKRYAKTDKRKKYNYERRRKPEVKKYMREHWKKWAKKNKEQLSIRMRLQQRLHKYMKKFINDSNYELIEKNRDNISLTIVAKYLLERLPKDFYKKKYHIDHIIPLCAFDLTKREQLIEAWSPENHQWLLAIENLKKQSEDKKLSIWKKN